MVATVGNDVIPDDDHVVRHCKATWFDDDGDLTSAAFKLRQDNGEEYLSVGWPEFFAGLTQDQQLANVRAELSSVRTVRPTHQLAVLQVGNTRNYVRANSPDHRNLLFKHKPIPNYNSHGGIFGLEPGGDMIAELVLQIVKGVISTKP